jgi:pimeloyl-ACP methyl ester carboxylesterase
LGRCARIGGWGRACWPTYSSAKPAALSSGGSRGYQRAAARPEIAAALLELIYHNDVRAELEHVRAPTLVVHRRGDRAIPYRLGRKLAAAIPGATLVPLDGGAHFTMHRHVANIRHKRGRASRTAAVAEAARLGLL